MYNNPVEEGLVFKAECYVIVVQYIMREKKEVSVVLV